MAGHDKERDRGHDHRSNGSTVQAAGAELAQQGTEDLRRLSSFLGSTPVAPAILDDASALPQGDGGTRPAFAGSAERGKRDLIVLDAGDVLHDAFAVRGPSIDAEGEVFSSGSSPSSSAPILLRFPLHRRSRRVLHLEPITRAPRAVERVPALRHDAFEPHLARMGEDGRAVAIEM